MLIETRRLTMKVYYGNFALGSIEGYLLNCKSFVCIIVLSYLEIREHNTGVAEKTTVNQKSRKIVPIAMPKTS